MWWTWTAPGTAPTANLESIRAIAGGCGLYIEVGGGIRDEARIETYLAMGVDRCILGTIAVKDFGFTARMARKYGSRIAVGVDLRDGCVAVAGWREVTPEPGLDFCRRCADAGVQAIIATDISRDGTLRGTNLELYRALLQIPGLRVTALRRHRPDGGAGRTVRHGLPRGDPGPVHLHRRHRPARGGAPVPVLKGGAQ